MIRKRCNLNSTVPATATEKPHKAARSPRWATYNRFMDYAARRLTAGAVVVWAILFRNADVEGLVQMSQDQIAERSPFAKTQTIIHLDTLEKFGYLKVISRGSRNKGPSQLRISAVSTLGNPQPKDPVTTIGNPQPKAIHNHRVIGIRKPDASTEERTRTPTDAFASSAGEEDTRAKSVEIGGEK